jgi:15-cis-phytoene synthase
MSPTREAHPARYFALLYSLPSQHAALEALFGIEREVFESLRPDLDHQIAHSRLQWWREECGRTADGQPVHPLTRTLVDTLRPQLSSASEGPLPALGGLSGFVDVAIWDLASATFETRRELTAYCERWAAAMIEPLVTRSLSTERNEVGSQGQAPRSGTSATSAPVWRTIGAAMREIELLSDLAHEAHLGRLRLPLDELDRTKALPEVLAKPPWPDQVAETLRVRQRALRNEIAAALSRLGGETQPTHRGLLVWVALMWRCSLRAERALPDRPQAGRFDEVSDVWFAWRVARKATMGKFTLS